MKIFITGGTGFIGRQLSRTLAEQGHQITILSRSGKKKQTVNLRFIKGNPQKSGVWQDDLKDHDTVINLAGSSVFCRWSRRNRQRIENSRILTTRNIVQAIGKPSSRVTTLISGSAIGYYGDCGSREITEDDPPSKKFLSTIARKWEQEALQAEKKGVRVILCRVGIVLGRSGGTLGKMIPAFRLGLGSALGNGQQWFSWIHEDDLVRAICLMIANNDIKGPVNLTAPNPVTNFDFSKSLAQTLHRPFFLPNIPDSLLMYVMGETSTLVLDSLKIRPQALLSNNFIFKYPEISAALQNLLKNY